MTDATKKTDFELWYQEFYPGLVASIAAAFGDVELACEAAADAIVRTLENWDRVGQMASPGGWSYTVAFNIARRRYRRKQIERRLLLASYTDPPMAREGAEREVWQLVANLPPRQRMAIALRHIAGLTESEVGDVMGITRGGVSSTLRNAYRSMHDSLGTFGK